MSVARDYWYSFGIGTGRAYTAALLKVSTWRRELARAQVESARLQLARDDLGEAG